MYIHSETDVSSSKFSYKLVGPNGDNKSSSLFNCYKHVLIGEAIMCNIPAVTRNNHHCPIVIFYVHCPNFAYIKMFIQFPLVV